MIEEVLLLSKFDKCVLETVQLPVAGLEKEEESLILPTPPNSFDLYAFLNSKGYFILPGIRFGCQYTVYPGDPLRYHSHFLAYGLEKSQKVKVSDIVGGGRLGTGVRKGWMMGAKIKDTETNSKDSNGKESDKMRVFCIEWAGFG